MLNARFRTVAGVTAMLCGTGARAQNIEPLLTAPAFVLGMLVVPGTIALGLSVWLWRDPSWRRAVSWAWAACLLLALVSLYAVTHFSGPYTLVWGLVFLATAWWCAICLAALAAWRAGRRRRPR